MKKYSVENTLNIPFFLPAIGDKILGSGTFHTDEPESQKFPLLFIIPIRFRVGCGGVSNISIRSTTTVFRPRLSTGLALSENIIYHS